MPIWKKKVPESLSEAEVLRCSFCNKSQRDVRKLIAGPNVLICDECIDICLEIIAEDKVAEAVAQVADQGETASCSFCGKGTVPIDIPKGTVICLSCITGRAGGMNTPKR